MVKFSQTKCRYGSIRSNEMQIWLKNKKINFFLSNRQEIQIDSTASPVHTDNDNSKKVNLAYISYEKKFQKKFF